MRRAGWLFLTFSLAVACANDRGRSPSRSSEEPQLRRECYSAVVESREGTIPVALNDAGQVLVAERHDDARGAYWTAFLWNDGARRALRIPEGFDSLGPAWAPQSLNDRGDVVGYAHDRATGDRQLFLWRKGRPTRIPVENVRFEFPYPFISETGIVAGTYVAPDDGKNHVFTYAGGTFTDLGLGVAYDINGRGDVVGLIDDGSDHGTVVLFSGGSGIIVGPSAEPQNLFINDSGQIVLSTVPTGYSEPWIVLWRDGSTELLMNTANRIVFALNERGDVAGTQEVFDEDDGDRNDLFFVHGRTRSFYQGVFDRPSLNDEGQILVLDRTLAAPYIFEDGERFDLPFRDEETPVALFINNSGMAVGAFSRSEGEEGLVIWRPDRCGVAPDAGTGGGDAPNDGGTGDDAEPLPEDPGED